ncbi:MAG TPA: pyridoxamine 5'-phosphate oxidase family protein [Candidatus Sulfotelmatobacter sp.]|nr:pyridoxamine 5'-phosphate oxidase family protein [Candidatus Sulfotelmatobacter sp.]
MGTKEDLFAFLNSHMLAVVSTVDPSGAPEAAVVGFGQTKDLELVFGTENTSRKYKNIMGNPRVAFVIGWSDATVQYEGTARELSVEELQIIKDNYWKKNPRVKSRNVNPKERYFLVKPTWIRYTDLKTKPWNIQELKF